jgi:hypothetical protein
LTTLELCSFNVYSKPTLTEFKCLVSASPSLINLTIHGSVIELLRPLGELVIKLPSLHSLSIGLFPKSYDYVFRLLNLLSMPVLEALELWTVTAQEWQSFRKYLYAEEKHFPRYPLLQSLTLVDLELINYGYRGFVPTAVGGHETLWLMRAIPSLTHISLIDVDPHKVLKGLLPGPGTTPDIPSLWPELQTMMLPLKVNVNFLRRLVSTRIELGFPLATLRLESPFLASIKPGDFSWLQERVRLEEFHRPPYTAIWDASNSWLPRHVIPSVDDADSAAALASSLELEQSTEIPTTRDPDIFVVPTAEDYRREYTPEPDFSSYFVDLDP